MKATVMNIAVDTEVFIMISGNLSGSGTVAKIKPFSGKI